MVTLGIDLTQPALTVKSRDAGPRAHGAGNNRVFKTNRSFACACGQVTFNKGAGGIGHALHCSKSFPITATLILRPNRLRSHKGNWRLSE